MTSIYSIQSLVLDLPPSCIEFCPVARDYFVVGTYFLEKKEQEATAEDTAENNNDEESEEVEKKPQTRTGSLILFKVEDDKAIQVSTTQTPYAILDIHFSPHDPTLLAVAGSTGCVQLFNLQSTSSSASLSPLSTYQYFDPSTLVLSLAWHPIIPSIIGVTTSPGQVYLVDTSIPAAEVEGTAKEILAHELEAWTLSFSASGTAVFSGGDDATLRFSALPSSFLTSTTTPTASNEDDEQEDQQYVLTWQDRRSHQAGVTAILPVPSEQDILITGSYDDNIRVLHAPLQGRKQVLAEENLEGGVWRLKMLRAEGEKSRYTVLASCMHAGARIVEVKKDEGGEWTIEVLAKFEEHKSMNYGSDVQPGSENGGEQSIISTSFYDKLLCLWTFTLP
ncbi:WD40 repeat-like protein [Aureobasidium pullulans]|uniref:methylated diphthine methylhydrolase n=1 Tax=Aureobasidium pullulans TaxID=5580 RepID=A0A4T0D9C4_AURPU|nr:WD40 repeat-like protein [Aureobasidium pullulans]TIA57551.1 WD40 repeat-like protein [Aureobasidium pullulans]